jgi:hypothetical protein
MHHKWIREKFTENMFEFPILVSDMPNQLRHLIYDCNILDDRSTSIYKIPSISDKFIIDTWSESIDIYEYEKIYNHLEKLGITKDNSIIVTMANHILENMYDNVVIFNSSFYIAVADFYYGNDFTYFPYSDQYLENLKLNTKSHKFLHFTGTAKTYRLYVLGYLNSMKYLNQGLYSFLNCESMDWLKMLWNSPNKSGGDERKRYYELYDFDEEFFSKEHALDYIMRKDGGKVPNPNSEFFKETLKYKGGFQTNVQMDFIKNTYFNILNETVFDSNDGASFMKNGAVTGKAIKGICHQPSLILSYPKTLTEIREFGFKTFPEMFDESYDCILNDEDRFFKILSIIDELMKLKDSDLHELYVKSLDNVVYNQYVIMETNPISLINNFFERISKK